MNAASERLQRTVLEQVTARFARGEAFPSLSPDDQRQIVADTTLVLTNVALLELQRLPAVDVEELAEHLADQTLHRFDHAPVARLEAYRRMVRRLLETAGATEATERQAQEHILSQFPKSFELDVDETGSRLRLREDADPESLGAAVESLGLGRTLETLDDEVVAEKLVPAARADLSRVLRNQLSSRFQMELAGLAAGVAVTGGPR